MDQLVLVPVDVLLLENQLPFQVLKLLSNNNEEKVKNSKERFLVCHHFQVLNRKVQYKDKNRINRYSNLTKGDHDLPESSIQVDQPLECLDPNSPTHLLRRLHSIVFGDHQHKKADNTKLEKVEKQKGGEGRSKKQ